ncbi:MAG TPA: zinc-dependent metalloprotease [Nitriliruptoraceae bacterium]|nr:zinc-dependent metalloprotease [Nitriliruptoraceae bacterium]
MLDTRTALATARLFMPAGVSDAAAAADLQRRVAAEWDELDAAARNWSQLGVDLPPTRGRVVGRMGWIRANVATMVPISEMVAARLERSAPGASRVMSVQVGGLFGLLSTKVLGQYVLPLAGQGSGQLLIVGPNVLSLATEFGDVADDLRRSVLVHEIVHRLQFDGTGWLGQYLRDLLHEYVEATDLRPERVKELAARLPDALREAVAASSPEPLMNAILTPPQQALMERAQGFMSLLEGHGNAAMSLGAADVVHDPEAVREALESRRGDLTSKVLTAVAGMDMKRRQYVDGEAFVRAVVEREGVDGLNRAFAEPANLPTLDEIADPAAWLQRTA